MKNYLYIGLFSLICGIESDAFAMDWSRLSQNLSSHQDLGDHEKMNFKEVQTLSRQTQQINVQELMDKMTLLRKRRQISIFGIPTARVTRLPWMKVPAVELKDDQPTPMENLSPELGDLRIDRPRDSGCNGCGESTNAASRQPDL